MDIDEPLSSGILPLPDQNRSNLASKVLFSSGGRIVGRGLNFLSQLLLARALGPEVFGIFAIGWNTLRLLLLVGPLGLEQGIIRYGSKYWKHSPSKLKGLFISSTLITLSTGILIGAALVLFSHQISVGIFKKPDLELVFHWLGFILPFSILLHVLASATTISQKIKYSIILEDLVQPLLQITFWVIFFFAGKRDLDGVLQSIFLSYLIPTVLVMIAIIRIFPEIIHTKPNYSFLKMDLFLFTIPASLAVLFGSLISWGDRLIVGYFRPAGDAGIYQAVSLVSIIFVTLLSGIKSVFAPVVARLYANAEYNRIKEMYTIYTRWGLYIGLGLFILIFVTGQDLLSVGFGSSYASGYQPLVILAFAEVINLGTGPLDIVLIMMGRQKAWLNITIQALLISLVLGILLTTQFGLIGTAISTSITVITTFILGFIQLRKVIPMNPYNKRCVLAVAGALFAGGAGLLFKFLTPQLNILLSLFLSAALILVIYGIWIGKVLATPEEKRKIIDAFIAFRRPIDLGRQRS